MANFYYYEKKCSYSTHLIKIIGKGQVNIYYLYLYLKQKTSFVNDTMFNGSTIKNLRTIQFFNWKIKIPSLPEQQKVANFFQNIDKQITLTKDNLTLLENRKKYLLQEMFI